MDEIKKWVFTICCGTLLCGVFSILTPSKSFEKITGLILGLFLLICFLTPIRVDLSGFQPEAESAEERRDSVAGETDRFFFRAAVEKSEDVIREIIYKQMEQYDIKAGDVQIYIETEDGSLDGEEKKIVVSVLLPQRMEQHHTVARKALEYELGVDVRLEYREEGAS